MLKRTNGEVKILGFDNIANEQGAKRNLGVVFDSNYFSDEWKISQVEKSISAFYENWNTQKFSGGCKFFCVYGGKILPVKFRYVQLAVELWY